MNKYLIVFFLGGGGEFFLKNFKVKNFLFDELEKNYYFEWLSPIKMRILNYVRTTVFNLVYMGWLSNVFCLKSALLRTFWHAFIKLVDILTNNHTVIISR